MKLVSSSWDGNVTVWDIFEGRGNKETLHHTHEVLCVDFHPDGSQLCTSTLDGILNFWNLKDSSVVQSIEGRRDLAGGQYLSENRSASHSNYGKYFTHISYSVDGKCILACGHSKWVCLYEIEHAVLLKKFLVSENASLEGVKDFYRNYQTEAGPIHELDVVSETNQSLYTAGYLPGSKKTDLGKRQEIQTIRVESIQFCPTGRSWACVTPEGILIYSLDENLIFDPTELDVEVTPDTILQHLKDGMYLKAFVVLDSFFY